MNVTIIGTGNMARGIGTRLLAGGNGVTLLGKEAGMAEALAEELHAGESGNPPVATGTFGDPIADEVVVLAIYYDDARAAVERYGVALDGKIVVDITNPVEPTLDGFVVPADSSAAEELQRLARGARFVKAFNTTFARTLTAGQAAGHPLDVFVAGDDETAKAQLSQLVEAGGLRPIDTGPLRRARELEALGLVHMAVQERLGTGFQSALKILF
jgi:8-hydroxy-5-deazaflavin:NADPH oxidoreductase